jgi:hypothetical protein
MLEGITVVAIPGKSYNVSVFPGWGLSQEPMPCCMYTLNAPKRLCPVAAGDVGSVAGNTEE